MKRILRINTLTFVSSILELSHYSLSLSHSWILRVFLESSWRVWHTWSFGARRKRKSKRIVGSMTTKDFSSRYQVSCMFSSLALTCMAYSCGLLIMIFH